MTLDLAADLSFLWWLLAGLLILIGIAVLPVLPEVVFFGCCSAPGSMDSRG